MRVKDFREFAEKHGIEIPDDKLRVLFDQEKREGFSDREHELAQVLLGLVEADQPVFDGRTGLPIVVVPVKYLEAAREILRILIPPAPKPTGMWGWDPTTTTFNDPLRNMSNTIKTMPDNTKFGRRL